MRYNLSHGNKPTRVIFCGDREWTDAFAVEAALLRLVPSKDVIITGGAQGADTIAHDLAAGMGFLLESYPAEWDKYHKAAGPIRNQQMLDSKPDLVIAFHHDLLRSKGTKDMVDRARKAGVRVILVTGAEGIPNGEEATVQEKGQVDE